MIVEDGTGIATASSYASEAAFEAYCEGRGLTFSGEVEPALVRASAWIDAEFGARYPGVRTHGRDQGLAWPRIGASDAEGIAIPSDAIPVEIQNATAEAALREIASAGSLAPDIAAGPAVKRERLGPMETEYAIPDGGRPAAPIFPVIRGILAPLIGRSGAGMVRLVRA